MEILPIKVLTDEDAVIFGKNQVSLGKLFRAGLPIPPGIVITPQSLNLETVLSLYDFGQKKIFEQSLEIAKQQIFKIPIPELLVHETKGKSSFYVQGKYITDANVLWKYLLSVWLEEIKQRLWKDGFYHGVTQNLDPIIVVFIKLPQVAGVSYCQINPREHQQIFGRDIITQIQHGDLTPAQTKELDELVIAADKKLLLPHRYTWVLEHGIKIIGISPIVHTPDLQIAKKIHYQIKEESVQKVLHKTVTKVFVDLAATNLVEYGYDFNGAYLITEKVLDLAKKSDSQDEILLKLMHYQQISDEKPILFKLADIPEHIGGVRGALRLIHQQSLFDLLCECINFMRDQKGYHNVHIVIPYVRALNELLDIKQKLSQHKLTRKHSLQIWLELAIPENVINLEEYIVQGIDGVVLNLDELISSISGFDHRQANVAFYKKNVQALLRFLENSVKILHKHDIPIIASGELVVDPIVLEFLVEKGAFGITVPRYESYSIADLLYQVEKKVLVKKTYQQPSIHA